MKLQARGDNMELHINGQVAMVFEQGQYGHIRFYKKQGLPAEYADGPDGTLKEMGYMANPFIYTEKLPEAE